MNSIDLSENVEVRGREWEVEGVKERIRGRSGERYGSAKNHLKIHDKDRADFDCIVMIKGRANIELHYSPWNSDLRSGSHP